MNKQFKTAARRGAAAVPNAVALSFDFETDEGVFKTLTAQPPTSGQIALFLGAQAEGGVRTIQALFDLLAAVLVQEEYDLIEAQLHEGLDVGVIIEIVEWLIEEWGARPTSPASDSPRSRNSTGRRSTAKRLNAVSTS